MVKGLKTLKAQMMEHRACFKFDQLLKWGLQKDNGAGTFSRDIWQLLHDANSL